MNLDEIKKPDPSIFDYEFHAVAYDPKSQIQNPKSVIQNPTSPHLINRDIFEPVANDPEILGGKPPRQELIR